MANTTASLLSFSLCLLLLCNAHATNIEPCREQQQPFGCRLERLNALEPTRRVESEAGVTEYWEQSSEELQCAGVAVHRRIIEPRGLLLPQFSNSPSLHYIVQGSGIRGTVLPGCPETYQSFEQGELRMEAGRSRRTRDEHQKIQQFRQGDIIAVPAGVTHWCYNNGETPVVVVTVHDTSSSHNQLDSNHRQFLLAGSMRGSQQHQFERKQRESSGDNILSGFDVETLSEVLGVSHETVRRIQGQDEQTRRRGEIVRVERGLRVVSPQRMREEEEQYYGEQEREGRRMAANGLEEALCTMRVRENIDDPARADMYTSRGGRMTNLNSQKLPILGSLRLSAQRVVLRKNAFQAPQWNINAHSVVYCTGGRGRLQIVSNQGRAVFDGELSRGQLVVVPQNFAVVKQAGNEGFEWVAFKTNDNAMTNQIVGKTSALRGMPVDVIMNSYRVSREEAMRLKFA